MAFLSEYASLVAYLQANEVTQPPIGGDVVLVHWEFLKNTGTPCTYTQFEELLNGLNDVFGILKFGVRAYNQRFIGEVDRTKLQLLHDKLFQVEHPHEEPVPTLLLSSVVDTFYSANNPLEMLEKLLNKPTAASKLARMRAKANTEVKPFVPVCRLTSHANRIAMLVSRHFSLLLSKNNPERVHRLLEKIERENPGSLSQDLVRCYQTKMHHLPMTGKHTDTTLGDCSYLDTCHKISSCRYLHYFTLPPSAPSPPPPPKDSTTLEYTIGDCFTEHTRKVLPPQWICCDVRYFPFSVLGKFAAIISDPAWDIHMNLPYGTCKDFELLELPMHELQDEGILLLWVTGRSIEIGRNALEQWGYQIHDEMIWIKLNQLKRTVVTGRTGHWLNHSKEHLLVGVKGNPPWINRLVDIDVIVSNTRETLRKPDEVYDVVERIVGKHSRKLEIFGRDHNIRPGWFSMLFLVKYLLTQQLATKSPPAPFMKRKSLINMRGTRPGALVLDLFSRAVVPDQLARLVVHGFFQVKFEAQPECDFVHHKEWRQHECLEEVVKQCGRPLFVDAVAVELGQPSHHVCHYGILHKLVS